MILGLILAMFVYFFLNEISQFYFVIITEGKLYL